MRAASVLSLSSLLFLGACASSDKAPATPDSTPATGGPVEPGVESVTQDTSGQLSRAVSQMSLKQQHQRFLLDEHLARAKELRELGRLEDALRETLFALEIDNDSVQARRINSDIAALLGQDPGRYVTVSQMLQEQYRIRIEQIKSEAQDSLNDGKLALIRGDYDAAIGELTITQILINSAPYALDWGGIDTEVTDLLARAKADRIAAVDARRRMAQEEAYGALVLAEQSERTRREAITAGMIEQAIESYERAQYDACMEFADQALRRSPRNSRAQEIRDAAFRSGREKVRSDYIIEKREQFARWREHLQELQIPWTDVITLPDQDDWRKLTQLRASRRGLDLTAGISPSEIQLRALLDSTRVRLPGISNEESLAAVINIVRDYTGLPLVVDPAAENLVLDEGAVFTLDLQNEITVTQALNLITKQAGEEVTWTVRHDAVILTSKEKARGQPVIVNHSVQDLIMGLTDFTGPRISRLRLLDELEDDDGGGPFGGILESPRLIEVEDLATLIQENVEVGSWDEDGVTIEPGEGFILITHSPAVQQRVRDFLEDLRRFNSSLVTIESKFMTIADKWIQQIGVDFRGLDDIDVTDVTNGLEDMASRGLDNGGSGSEGADAAGAPSAGFFFDDGGDGDFRGRTENFFNTALGSTMSLVGGLTFQLTFFDDAEISAILRAIEKETQFEIVNTQMLSVHNTQRAYVAVINQQAYIQDFDVEVAQFQAVADPQIYVLQEGVVLDLRPTIHHYRKYLTLEIQPTVAKIVALRTFSTTLGGNTSPVDFQLPELEVQSVNTSAIIPDGGSILLGGLSSIRNVERRAEVPWLAKIPLLGFFFKQEGYNDERESLMILIKASITDVREVVKEKLERRY
ncbi:MAG: hypothetical protein V3T22_13530 [Planctomycetota bacterium]